MNYVTEVTGQLAEALAEDSPKCECTDVGQWVFRYDGRLFQFHPSTQMQKDIWLGTTAGVGPKSKEGRVKALRWFCGACGTVQLP